MTNAQQNAPSEHTDKRQHITPPVAAFLAVCGAASLALGVYTSARAGNLVLAGACTVAFVWSVIYWLPMLLVRARRGSGTLEAKDGLGAENDVRTTLVQAIAGAALLGGLIFTAHTVDLTRQQVRATNLTLQLSRQGQIADRYARAVSMLQQAGASNIDARLGGIYSLEQVAQDSVTDSAVQKSVRDTLAAFLRAHDTKPTNAAAPSPPGLTADFQAAATVLGRNRWGDEWGRFDLTGVALQEADLSGLRFDNALLGNTNLGDANLAAAQLAGADLSGASLQGRSVLAGADVRDAKLYGTKLKGTDLRGVHDLTADNLTTAITDPQTKLLPSQQPLPARHGSGVSILRPHNGDVVTMKPAISGAVTDAVHDQLWVVTHPIISGGRYYPQGVSFPNYGSGIDVHAYAGGGGAVWDLTGGQAVVGGRRMRESSLTLWR